MMFLAEPLLNGHLHKAANCLVHKSGRLTEVRLYIEQLPTYCA